jgi:hypothetical protein
MAAGNYLGAGLASVFSITMWWIFGAAFDKLAVVFNKTISLLPSFQDAVSGFTLTQQIYLISIVVIILGIWINAALNEVTDASGVI